MKPEGADENLAVTKTVCRCRVEAMKRVVVDHYGGPEVLKVVEEDDPRPGPGEVRVRVLAAGVSFTDAQLRAGTYIPGAPKPPFTPGYELVGVVEELGPGCTRLQVGDRIGALTVWGADADRVCVPEAGAVEVPEDLDPAEVLSLLFPYMTAYQVLHRTAMVKSGETVLVHGAAGRVGIAALELGTVAGLRLYGTCSARDRAAVERLGAVAIDYRNEDFLARVRELTEAKAWTSCSTRSVARSRCAPSARCGRGGRLVVFGRYATLSHGHKDRRAVIKWYAAIATVWLWGKLSPRRRVFAYHDPEVPRRCRGEPEQWAGSPATRSGSGRTSPRWSGCSARARSTRSWPSACRSPKLVTRTSYWRARHRRASSCSCHRPTRTPPIARFSSLASVCGSTADTLASTRKQK